MTTPDDVVGPHNLKLGWGVWQAQAKVDEPILAGIRN
jgi:hypothetical protein